ncbi:MAG: sortase [Acidimicrobiaceae bacterium]|nr:sortase [Acidimicrobiaceae bacterium]
MRGRRYRGRMDWRRWVGGLGRTLIAAGTLILLFVVYQLWGTGIAEARSQRGLVDDFRRAHPGLARGGPSTTGVPGPEPTTTTTFPDAPGPAPTGSAVAIIRIPKIGVDKAVVEGVALSDLKKGPGHYSATPMPGQPGNAAIAGHRTTYGAPFYRLDELSKGDKIYVTTPQGAFEYHVRETQVVKPSDVFVLDSTPDNRLTLTTCNPRFSARQRMVVVSDLIGPAAPAPPPSAVVPGPGPEGGDNPVVGSTTTTTTGSGTGTGSGSQFEGGLSGQRAPKGPALLWGLAAALVAFGVWVLSRRWRRWPAYLLGAPVFLLVLFVFFENFSRLLPANF